MFSYPLDKYRFYTNNRKVVAVSSYAGRTVRGVAKCSEGDSFDIEKGKELAAARCALKIAEKRVNRASEKYRLAQERVEQAIAYRDNMQEYFTGANYALHTAESLVADILDDM